MLFCAVGSRPQKRHRLVVLYARPMFMGSAQQPSSAGRARTDRGRGRNCGCKGEADDERPRGRSLLSGCSAPWTWPLSTSLWSWSASVTAPPWSPLFSGTLYPAAEYGAMNGQRTTGSLLPGTNTRQWTIRDTSCIRSSASIRTT